MLSLSLSLFLYLFIYLSLLIGFSAFAVPAYANHEKLPHGTKPVLVRKSSTALKPGKAYPGAKKPIVDKPLPPRRPITPGNKDTTTQSFSALSSGGIGVYTSTQAAQSFDTDLFTGTAQTEIPILVPPGAAGVAPKIALRYNSEDADIYIDWNEQGPGPGLGWTIDVGGYIVREPGPVEWPAVEDRFKLIFGGAGHDLVLIDAANNIYHTKDETFLEAKYYPSEDYWTLKTKDGTVHRFGYGANHSTKARSLRPDLVTPYTARYMLDEVTTTSGVSTRYEY